MSDSPELPAGEARPPMSPDVVLTSPQAEQFRDAVCDAFGHEDDLEQVVRFKLGVRLFDVVAHGPLQRVVYNLIRAAENEGYTEALIRAVLESRGRNLSVATFVQANFPHFLIPVTPERLAQEIKGGLIAAVQLRDEREVQRIVGRFRADFVTTRTHVAELSKYKSLHDRLHRLQLGLLGALTDEAKRWLPRQPCAHPLDLYAFQIRREVAPARNDAAGLPNEPEERRWIDSLPKVADHLEEAAETMNPERLRQALVVFRRALTELHRINSSLASTAARLGLPKLVEAMGEFSRSLPANDGALERQHIREVRTGQNGLQVLRPRLGGLVEEHFAWQWLDKEIAAAHAEQGTSLAEKFILWDDVHAELSRLCNSSPEQEWSRFLRRVIDALSAAGAAEDSIVFDERFLTFRTVARDRFVEVDDELLHLAEQLARWAEPIDVLLRISTNDNHA